MLSAHFDLTPEEQALELARFLEEINPESQGITAESQEKIVAAQTPEAVQVALTEIVTKLVERSAAFLAVKDAEAATPFYALAKLAYCGEAEKASNLILSLARTAASNPADKPKARAKALAMLFNVLDIVDPARYEVYLLLVQFSGKTRITPSLTTQLEQQLDDWLREWGADADQTRVLYKAVATAYKECGVTAMAKKFTYLLLKSLNGADGALLALYKDDAKSAVIEALADPETYQFDELMSFDAVKTLAALSSEPCYKLLNIFIVDEVTQFRQFEKENPGFFEANGLDVEQCLRKLRLLTLVSLCADTAEVQYSDIQSRLELSEKDVEFWIIDAIRANLVDARMDQLQQRMIVRRSMQRTFGKEDWEKLAERLAAWTASVTEMAETIVKVREQTNYRRGA